MSHCRWVLLVVLCLVGSVGSVGSAGERGLWEYPPTYSEGRDEIYKTVGDTKLTIHILTPPGHMDSDRRGAIVFFFGGGWRKGTPGQFYPQAKRMVARGMVAFLPDYRVASRHGVKVVECIRDAKDAARWIRANADRLGVNPQRIVAAGGSAGGHLAAATAIVPGFEDDEESKVSSVPNALALFNSALVLAPVDDMPAIEPDWLVLRQRLIFGLEAFNPARMSTLGEDMPPEVLAVTMH